MNILLTRSTGEKCLVNPTRISSALVAGEHGDTVVNMVDSDRGLWVREAPEDIYDLQQRAIDRALRAAAAGPTYRIIGEL